MDKSSQKSNTTGAVSTRPISFEQQTFIDTKANVWNCSLLSEDDVRNFQHGTHYALYEIMGSRSIEVMGVWGLYFCVWAPNATELSVKGHFNEWRNHEYNLYPRWDKSGIWEGFIPHLGWGETYKYHITGFAGRKLDKGDPFANYWERRPHTASITWNLNYEWQDQAWMQKRKEHNALDAPWSIYELHLASWQRPVPSDEESYNSYDQIARQLIPYLLDLSFTHVEFMPVMEHPFDGSWGYQCTGFFAPTSRFGDPQGFMRLIDELHQAGIGVILDWVPSHFPYDAHGLFMFDGTHTYEYADMRKGFHPDWNSYVFNYKRGEVKSFLISSARFWFDKFHIDGIRVDAVSSMLKLNYSRTEGQWEPNEFGGDGNLEAIAFLKDLNETIYRDFPDVQTIAEEATDWPGISQPTFQGGLGFGMKWMMGWMNDTLRFFQKDPIYRQHHLNELTFSLIYAFAENFCLPLSHDEVVYGKGALLQKMPGDDWQKFANLRLLFSEQFMHPGTKLVFQGGEFGQSNEWNHDQSIDWHLTELPAHQGIQNTVKALNKLYRQEPALHIKQFDYDGFEWIEGNDQGNTVISFLRKGETAKQQIIVILNLTPIPRENYRIGVPLPGVWKVIFNSDQGIYGGSDYPISGAVMTEEINWQGKAFSISINLPPLSALVLKA